MFFLKKKKKALENIAKPIYIFILFLKMGDNDALFFKIIFYF